MNREAYDRFGRYDGRIQLPIELATLVDLIDMASPTLLSGVAKESLLARIQMQLDSGHHLPLPLGEDE